MVADDLRLLEPISLFEFMRKLAAQEHLVQELEAVVVEETLIPLQEMALLAET